MGAVRWRSGRAVHAGWLHWVVVQPTDADRKVPITPVCHRRFQRVIWTAGPRRAAVHRAQHCASSACRLGAKLLWYGILHTSKMKN